MILGIESCETNLGWLIIRRCEQLAEQTLIALAIPAEQMSVMHLMMLALATDNLYHLCMMMLVERLDPHLHQHDHQQ